MASKNVNNSRMEYLAGRLSDNDILNTTGISKSLFNAYNEGKADIGKEEQRLLRNLFQRTVYNEARSRGMSAAQAKGLSWQTAETVERRKDRFEDIVMNLVERGIQNKVAKNPKRMEEYLTPEYKEKLEDSIRKGLRKTKNSIPDIERY